MESKMNRAWRGAMLPLIGAALLLPSVDSLAGHTKGKAATQGPSDQQIRDFNSGRKLWDTARGKDARERSDILERSAKSFQSATRARRPFPEALLALGLIRYSQNNLSGAHSLFSEAARLSRGPVRIEALTHLGLIALRQSRWAAADEAFEDALKDDPRDYTSWSRNEKERTALIRSMTARGEHFKRVARIGSLFSTYYDAATATEGREPKLRALLREVNERFPASEIPFYQFELDDVKAALVEFPTGPVNFAHNYLDGRPAGSQKLLLEDFLQGVRIWALAELGQQPQPGLDRLSGRDLDNAIAGLQRRALELERSNPEGALEAWRQLSVYPGIGRYPRVALMARQHRVYLLLQRGNLADVRTLVRGPGMANDPLLYDQQLALAAALVRTAPASGPARFEALRRAMEEFRVVVDGLPGASVRPTEAQRSLAEWNLAALTVSTSPQAGPAEWEQRLNRFPALPGREAILLYVASQWAESALEAGDPGALGRAVEAADRIASGRFSPGLQGVARGSEFMALLRRYLARRIFERREVARYQDFLRTTDYGGEYRAWDASKLYRQRVDRLRGNADLVADDPSTYENILRVLMEARTMTGSNADLQRRLDNDIAGTRAYLEALRQNPPRLTLEWNKAAGTTNSAKSPADWQRAADAWRGVLGMLAGRAQQQRRDAAMHIVHAYMRQADLLRMEGDRAGAREALQQARAALQIEGGVGAELSEDDRQMLAARLANNLRALQPAEEIAGPSRGFDPYAGPVVPPDQNRCVITRYPGKIDPDVEGWIENLRNRPSSVRRLVDWFNNGPMARNTPGAKRNFSADPNSPDYLVDFLDHNLSRTVGVLPIGSRQWCDHNGAGPWHSAVTTKTAAAYFLRNGTPIIRVACDNPLNPIRVVRTTARWIECEEKAVLIIPPVAPAISYGEPQAPFSFPVPQAYKSFVLPAPAGTPVESIIQPPAALYVAPQVLPLLPLEVCRAVGDC